MPDPAKELPPEKDKGEEAKDPAAEKEAAQKGGQEAFKPGERSPVVSSGTGSAEKVLPVATISGGETAAAKAGDRAVRSGEQLLKEFIGNDQRTGKQYADVMKGMSPAEIPLFVSEYMKQHPDAAVGFINGILERSEMPHEGTWIETMAKAQGTVVASELPAERQGSDRVVQPNTPADAQVRSAEQLLKDYAGSGSETGAHYAGVMRGMNASEIPLFVNEFFKKNPDVALENLAFMLERVEVPHQQVWVDSIKKEVEAARKQGVEDLKGVDARIREGRESGPTLERIREGFAENAPLGRRAPTLDDATMKQLFEKTPEERKMLIERVPKYEYKAERFHTLTEEEAAEVRKNYPDEKVSKPPRQAQAGDVIHIQDGDLKSILANDGKGFGLVYSKEEAAAKFQPVEGKPGFLREKVPAKEAIYLPDGARNPDPRGADYPPGSILMKGPEGYEYDLSFVIRPDSVLEARYSEDMLKPADEKSAKLFEDARLRAQSAQQAQEKRFVDNAARALDKPGATAAELASALDRKLNDSLKKSLGLDANAGTAEIEEGLRSAIEKEGLLDPSAKERVGLWSSLSGSGLRDRVSRHVLDAVMNLRFNESSEMAEAKLRLAIDQASSAATGKARTLESLGEQARVERLERQKDAEAGFTRRPDKNGLDKISASEIAASLREAAATEKNLESLTRKMSELEQGGAAVKEGVAEYLAAETAKLADPEQSGKAQIRDRMKMVAGAMDQLVHDQLTSDRPSERNLGTADNLGRMETKVASDGSLSRTDNAAVDKARQELERRERLSPSEIEALRRQGEQLAKAESAVERERGEALLRAVDALDGKLGAEAQKAAHRIVLDASRSALEKGEGGGYGRAVTGGLIGLGILTAAALAYYRSKQKSEEKPMERAKLK
ncbi:MAG: hypothetical protein K2X27_03095 [Candidatus Obscuribacterales bacterium]|nr:hypothetical protein [Candidatus Obscuribacterales bacterium]